MKKTIIPLTNIVIQEIIDTAQALVGRSVTALGREYPRSKHTHPNSSAYIIDHNDYSITWFANIFKICDISLIQFNSEEDVETCINICNETLEVLNPNMWMGEDTIIQYYKEARTGNKLILVGWRYSSILK